MVRGEARMKKRKATFRGASIMFDEKSRKEFITGFRRRKEERREYGKQLAKDKEIEQRKDIKRMHRETVEEKFGKYFGYLLFSEMRGKILYYNPIFFF